MHDVTVSFIFGLMMMGALTGLVTTFLDDDGCSKLNDEEAMIKLCLEANEQIRQIMIIGWIVFLGSGIIIHIIIHNNKIKQNKLPSSDDTK